MSIKSTDTFNKTNYPTIKSKQIFRDLDPLYSQIVLTCAVCIGSYSYGHMLGWSKASWQHLTCFEKEEITCDQVYTWIACVSSLGTSIGIVLWGYLTFKIGPKKTLLLSSILLSLCWILIACSETYNLYWSSVLMASLCASSYLYSGEVFLLECAQRKYIKVLFAIFRSCIILGVMSMNILASFLDKLWLCLILSLLSTTFAVLISFLPDSPRYLINTSEFQAENSLKFYMGKETVAQELSMVRQQRFSLNIEYVSSKVVIKTIIIITLLQFFKSCTGYYVFLMDSIRIMSKLPTVFGLQIDHVILSIFLLASRLTGCFAHLYGHFGIKKPMMCSMLLVSIILFFMGLIHFISCKKYAVPINGSILIIFIIYVISYDIGMELCPEITLYAYTPCEIYELLWKIMIILQWMLLFPVVRLYLYCQLHFEAYQPIWIFMGISIIGFIFISMYVIDVNGKSLVHIQMELGGNPVGTRSSIRQRLANPFERTEDINYLHNLIAADLARTRNTERVT